MNLSAAAADPTQLVVRSNIHLTNLDVAFRKLLQHEQFVDVTLACDGATFKCHRLILAAASPLFESLFAENSERHPIVIIPIGIQAWAMQALIDFMYKGQVNVPEGCIDELFESAKMLQISSLCRTQMLPPSSNDNSTRTAGDSSGSKNCDSRQQQLIRSPIESTHANDSNDNEYDGGDVLDDNDDRTFNKSGSNAAEEGIKSFDADNNCDILNVSGVVEGEELLSQLELELEKHIDKSKSKRANKCNSYVPPSSPAGSDEEAGAQATEMVGAIRVKPKAMLFDNVAFRKSAFFHGMQRKKSRIPTWTNSHVNTANLEELGITFDEAGTGLQLIKEEKFNDELDLQPNQLSLTAGNSNSEQFSPTHTTTSASHCNPLRISKSFTDVVDNAIHVKAEIIEDGMGYSETENIIIQPNVSYIYSHDDNHDASNHFFNSFVNGSDGDFVSSQNLKNLLRNNGDLTSYGQAGDSKIMAHANLHRALMKTKFSGGMVRHQTKPPVQYTIDTLPKLRAPRSNQARTYCSKDLHNALMAVKHGDSIYNASRKYKVPRKTLRNWMKRMEIKSKFPMPKQLKDYTKRKQLDLAERQLKMQIQQQQDLYLN